MASVGPPMVARKARKNANITLSTMARAAFGCNSTMEHIKKVRASNLSSCSTHKSYIFAVDLLRQIGVLRRDYHIAKTEGIVGADKQLLPPQSVECKKILSDIETILQCIDRNNHIVREAFAAGAKMFVVGMPIWNEWFKEVQLFAFNIHEDSGLNRDMEINFKKHLFRLYETRYLKFTRDGKPIR